MKKYISLLILSIILIISPCSFSREIVIYKYLTSNNIYETFIMSEKDMIDEYSSKGIITININTSTFTLEYIPKDLYNIKITKGLIFFGRTVTQYNIEPKYKDRFTHIVWVDEKSDKLIKKEIYSNDNRLQIAYVKVDLQDISEVLKVKKKKHIERESFYKGFIHKNSKILIDGVIHMVFSDGLNRFSLFINPNTEENGTISKVIYGNYLLSKVVLGVEYTVIGTLSYDIMNKIINIISKYKLDILHVIQSGEPITKSIYDKNSIEGDSKR